jgi:hypothetical protein
VAVGDSAPVDATVSVDRRAAHPWFDRDGGLEAFAAAHGGTFVGAADIGPLVDALRAPAARQSARETRPMRGAWWIVPFAGLLGAEWTLRRRRHLH